MANPTPNVVIFGEAGVGKSSVINMVLGYDAARVGNRINGCTFETAVYHVRINGEYFNLYDTAGLDEVNTGRVESAQAIKNLYQLVKKLSDPTSGGINLLVLVAKAGVLTRTIQRNYTLFRKGFCESQVPIVLVVTGCENVEPTMDNWWTENMEEFSNASLSFSGHACVCASRGRMTRGGNYVNEEPFQDSKEIIERLIPFHCEKIGWKQSPMGWLRRVYSFFKSSANDDGPSKLREHLASAFSRAEVDGIIEAVKRA